MFTTAFRVHKVHEMSNEQSSGTHNTYTHKWIYNTGFNHRYIYIYIYTKYTTFDLALHGQFAITQLHQYAILDLIAINPMLLVRGVVCPVVSGRCTNDTAITAV